MKLAKREKLFIGGAAGIIGILVIMQLIIFPYFDKKNRMEKEIESFIKYSKIMDEVGSNGQSDNFSSNMDSVLAKRSPSFSLTSLINESAKAAGKLPTKMDPQKGKDKGNWNYMEEIIQVPFKGITSSQLYDFLYRIEKPEELIFIKQLNVKKAKNQEGYLDATIRIMTYHKQDS